MSTDEDIAWLKSTFHPIPKPALPDDCIEYSLHLFNPTLDSINDSELRLRLRDVQKYSNELQKIWLKEYIWQRQSFSFELAKEDGVSYLRGRTEYGDSIEDEWVVVWLLREISKKYADAWIKLTDTDGEFLLIEASGTLPAWLEPEVAENRVWINRQGLKILKPENATRTSKSTNEKLSLQNAKQIILNEPKRVMHSTIIEEEAFYRLRNYPGQIKNNMHHAIVTLPRKVAYLLLQKSAYISIAVEAFYLRDQISLKPLQAKDAMDTLLFPPTDLVSMSVRFPKVAYAQLKSQEFPAPLVWKSLLSSPPNSSSQSRMESGMKVASGFEMLLSDQHYQDRPGVREMKMLLDDLSSGDEELPSDERIAGLGGRQDDEGWLDIDFNDLERELAGKQKADSNERKKDFGDRAAQENLQRIVKQFEDFLNDDNAGPDGADLFEGESDDEDLEEDSDGEDEEASFGDDDFTNLMQEMMGMPPEVMKELMSGKIDALNNTAKPAGPERPPAMQASVVDETHDSSEEGDGEDIQSIMKQMGAELRASGALDLNPSGPSRASRAITNVGSADTDKDSSEEDDDLNEIDINLARNLLESFKSQAGMAGPASNLMGLMGSQLPRDAGDQTDNSSARVEQKK